MKLRFNHCADMGDWYTIVKAEHEGIEEMRPCGPNAMRFYTSERISDACVEGTLAEMLDIAQAIEDRAEDSHKRCAVDATTDRVKFWSPRNSRRPGIVSREDAEDLARQIREVAAATENTGQPGGGRA